MRTRRLSIFEVAVVAAVVAALLAVMLPIALHMGGRARRHLDASQIKQIHQAWLASAQANKRGELLPPGAVSEACNEHASLHSYLVACNLFAPDLLCSPNDPNPRVVVCTSYNYDAYNPAQGTYWDKSAITCDLDTKCNVSYALMPLDRTPRRRDHFRTDMTSNFPMLGHRGRKGGIDGSWNGYLCFGDNHIELALSTTPAMIATLPAGPAGVAGVPDNLFKNDTFALPSNNPLRNSDVFLVIQKEAAAPGSYITEDSPELTWD